MTVPLIRRPPGTTPYKDTQRYQGAFGFVNDDGTAEYKIAWDDAQGCWVCSCPGAIHHGHCKHLTKRFQLRPTRADLVAAGRAGLDFLALKKNVAGPDAQRLKLTPNMTRRGVTPIRAAPLPIPVERPAFEPPPILARPFSFTTNRVRRIARDGEV